MDTVVSEAAVSLGDLYGPAAAESYRAKAPSAMRSNIANPGVYALGAFDGSRLAGVLLSLLRAPVAEIPFMHVLAAHVGTGVEQALVDATVQLYRAGGVDGILCECLPLSTMALREPFARHGFTAIEREIMTADLRSSELRAAPAKPCPALTEAQWENVARTLVAAYEGDPGRLLHLEVSGEPYALDFLRRVTSGSFGVSQADYCRVYVDGGCQGVILGCEAAPGVGFVLQVAVHPVHRGQGIATSLLRAQAEVYRRCGLRRVSLGVTSNNPARRLYARMGFVTARPVEAYVWWRPGCSPLPERGGG